MEAKSQHFLLSAKARALSTKRIDRLSDEQAYAEFIAIRFADNDGRPRCPWCNHPEAYAITSRRKWKCKSASCRRQFSATSRTSFSNRKLGYRDILLLVAHFTNALKGISAIRLSFELEVSYKTAFVRLHKLREVLESIQQSNVLRGLIEVDGAYFGGYKRPKNHQPSRVDRRRLPHRTGKRQCINILRERHGRSRPLLCSETDVASQIRSLVEPGSIIYTDANSDFGRIAAHFVHHKVNHSERYADGDNCTNWAESYFSRLRRYEIGTHHHIAGPHLFHYANEASWREDRRRYNNQENYDAILGAATRHPVSRKWTGYWQRRRVAA